MHDRGKPQGLRLGTNSICHRTVLREMGGRQKLARYLPAEGGPLWKYASLGGMLVSALSLIELLDFLKIMCIGFNFKIERGQLTHRGAAGQEE